MKLFGNKLILIRIDLKQAKNSQLTNDNPDAFVICKPNTVSVS